MFIQFLLERRAILFDMGDMHNLSVRDILKVSHAFISHTHVDHFIGFDTLLRHFVGREKNLVIYGPGGFLKNLEGRLRGYTWNLVGEFENEFLIQGVEVNQNTMKKKIYSCRNSFKWQEDKREEPFSGILLKDSYFTVEGEFFEHRVPCLGFSLKERFHINIKKDRLQEMDLPVGPWLNRFKKCIYNGKSYESDFKVTWERRGTVEKEKVFKLGYLVDEIATITPGAKITYITDISGSQENIEKAIRLAKDADHLFIEAVFLHRDREMARRKSHLTARDAGLIARDAEVKKLTVFHFSSRYMEHPEELTREAMDVFKGKV